MAGATAPVTLADWGELKFLRWVRRVAGEDWTEGTSPLAMGIGDDAAHFRFRGLKDLLVTTDTLIEGVHFKRAWISPRDLGHKSLASNLSDIAAMGGAPVAEFLSLGVPPSASINALKRFFGGLCEFGRRWNCPLAGGDLVRAPQWVINIMVLGQPAVGERVVRRRDARAGQKVYVTGSPGESGAGLAALRRGDRQPFLIARHNRPTPRLDEARVLAETCPDLAMIDVSDGIVNDAGHLARESRVRIEIFPDKFLISRELARYARKTGADPLDWILDGGEDYELLFTTKTPVEKIQKAFASRKIETPVSWIGRVVEGPSGVRLLDAKGKLLRRAAKTFQHFA